MLLENGDPAQLPAVALCKLAENSSKSDSVLGIFSAINEEYGSGGQDIFTPRINNEKKAMLAKMTYWVFGLFWGISNRKRGIGIGTYERNTGVETYFRAYNRGRFKELVRAPATAFERRINLLSLAMPRWQVGNPLVFQPQESADFIEELVATRFRGGDGLSKLVDTVLGETVASAPT